MMLPIFSIQKRLKKARSKSEKVLAYVYRVRVLTHFQRESRVFDSVKSPAFSLKMKEYSYCPSCRRAS
jgi:hypothetical protein